MKKSWLILIIILVFLIACSYKNTNKEFRIRVIANSDLPIDIEIKNKVAQLAFNEINLLKEENKDVRIVIENNINYFKKVINNYLKTISVDTKAEVIITKEKFPTKQLDGKVISGGKYACLLITIGKGEGSNWWSLLYPEFFSCSFEDLKSGEVEYKSYFKEKYKSIFSK